jgi:hypothetical protein
VQESPEAALEAGRRFPPQNMKPRFVSAVAMLFCCAILAMVGLFAYSKYKAAQAANAAFRAQLQVVAQGQSGVLGTRMPDQLPSRGSSVAAEASATP